MAVREIVAIDIGGTNARFAIARADDDGTITLGEPVILEPHGFAGFETAWEQFRALAGGKVPDDVALALAGPVDVPEIRLANIPEWLIRRAGLETRMGVARLTLINDFGAMGHAVATLPPSDFRKLAGPDRDLPAAGTISVIGPGTGLGVAHVWRDGRPVHEGGFSHVQSTEGGHIDFAPIDAIDDAILVRLRARHGRVSAERVASGPAIVDIYETLATLEGRAVVLGDSAMIWHRADAGDDPLAVAAAERFCLLLGSVAGDLALAQGASAVVLSGGVAQRQAARIAASGFYGRFTAKGRFRGLMESLPIKLITHPHPGLLGAAAAFLKEHPQ